MVSYDLQGVDPACASKYVEWGTSIIISIRVSVSISVSVSVSVSASVSVSSSSSSSSSSSTSTGTSTGTSTSTSTSSSTSTSTCSSVRHRRLPDLRPRGRERLGARGTYNIHIICVSVYTYI